MPLNISSRVIVASLFLPQTVEFEETVNNPGSPSLTDVSEDGDAPHLLLGSESHTPSLSQQVISANGPMGHQKPPAGEHRNSSGHGAKTPGLGGLSAGLVAGRPGLSIIDDLQSKSKATSPMHTPYTPAPESSQNPFFAPNLPSVSLASNLAARALGNLHASAPGVAPSPPNGSATPSSTKSLLSVTAEPKVPAAGRPTVASNRSSYGSGPGGRLPASPIITDVPTHKKNRSSASSIEGITGSPLSATSLTPSGRLGMSPSPSSTGSSATLGRRASRSSSRRRSFLPPSPDLSSSAFNHHPFHLTHNSQGNGGLQNAMGTVANETAGTLWIGALGNRTDFIGKVTRREVEKRLLPEANSIPVWVEDKTMEGCYDVYCKQILWPTFHYMFVKHEADILQGWSDYVKVNQAFADTIVAAYHTGDTIFVNDYHLLLVPSMVREKLPKAIIGFFLHVSFPSSELFRSLAVREQLLRGMLGANLIGFQTYNYARHFRQTVNRVLQSVEATPKGIRTESSFVDVEVFGIGIDVEALDQRKLEPDVLDWSNSLREKYGDIKLIVGRDKLDEVKGLKHKFLAFETFLQNHPEWQGKVILIQVALSTSISNEAQENAADIVARINSKYSTLTYSPVVFLHTEPPTFSQYLALLTVADGFIATSLREGMNLTVHEFIRCQSQKHSPVILSEFVGTYSKSSFQQCLPVNPFDHAAVAEAIHTALEMGPKEREDRWIQLNKYVTTHTAQTWARRYLAHLERAHFEQQRRLPGEVPTFDIKAIKPKFDQAKNKLIVVDLEGALWLDDPLQTRATGFTPPQSLIDTLKAVSCLPNTHVYVLSGRGIADLDKISQFVPQIGIVAENGCFILPASPTGAERNWISQITDSDMSWRTPCIEILEYFSERTPGAYIEDRGASILWRFSDAQSCVLPETGDFLWAKRQAAEAQNHVSDVLCEKYKLQIYPGRTAFLVMPRRASRVNAVVSLLAPQAGSAVAPTPKASAVPSIVPVFDSIIAFTDDERIISGLNSLKAKGQSVVVETVSVGCEKETSAAWSTDTVAILDVLKELGQ